MRYSYQSNLIESFNGFKTLNNSDLFSLGFIIESVLDQATENIEELESILYDVDTISELRSSEADEKNHTSTYFEVKRQILKLG